MVIPDPTIDGRFLAFYERLGLYQKVYREIHGIFFLFIIEQPGVNNIHPCTVEDLDFLILHTPAKYFGKLKTIVLRQPKRKERLLSSVWGRLIYSYAFEEDYIPAIILESVEIGEKLRWKRKLNVENQKELDRLRADGHPIVETKRAYEFELTREASRNIQLYRTFLHELGHWVHSEQYTDDWETYSQLPASEREAFAHRFADTLRSELVGSAVILYERKYSSEK